VRLHFSHEFVEMTSKRFDKWFDCFIDVNG